MDRRSGTTGPEHAPGRASQTGTRAPRVGFGAILLATMLGACAGIGIHVLWPEVGAAGNAPAPEAQVEGAQLRRGDDGDVAPSHRLGAGVVLVEASGCGERRQASATVVQSSAGELILTNAHVVRGSGTVTVQAGDGTIWTARVVGVIAGRDAAVLRVDDLTSLDAMPVAPTPGPGAPVAVVGYPAGRPEVRTGQVASIERRSGYGGSTDMLVVDTPTTDGQSGGAVLDPSGRAIGLVAARDPGSGDTVAYPIDALLDGTLAPIPTC